ncbi:Dpf-4 [Aphelenchoides fujianensis]|nr:Dpf-4 [Aphelenchoides fujianensis]
MAAPFVIPPNAKYEPQNAETVSFDTSSKEIEAVKARLFAGCLNPEVCRREDVIQLFSMYGELSGVTFFAKGGYAFVQFVREEDAIEAIRNLDRWHFQGCLLDVKLAVPPQKSHGQPFGARGMKRPFNSLQHMQRAKTSRFDGPPGGRTVGFFRGAHNPRTNAPFPLRGGGRRGRGGNRLGGWTPADGGGFGQYGAQEGGFHEYSAGPSSSNFHYGHDGSTGEYGEASGHSFDGYEQQEAFDYAADWSEYPQEPAHEYSQEFGGEETSGQFDHPPPAGWDSREFEAGGSQTPQSAASGYSRGKSGPSFGPPPRRPPVQPLVQPRFGRADGRKAAQPADETPNEHEKHAIPDVFICGGCHWTTTNPRFFVQHRMKPCGMSQVKKGEGEPPVLKCQMCAVLCKNAWDLVAHLGKKHSIYLFNETLFPNPN